MRLAFAFRSLALTATLATSLQGQGPMRPAPSGRATTEVVLTLVDSVARATAQPARIRVDYGQPHLRGRRLFTDSLVPYDKPWRTGANEPTVLETDVELVLGGARLPKGRYVLQTIPARAGWKLLVQQPPAAPAANAGTAPAPPREVARVDLRTSTLAAPVESFTIWLIPGTQPGAARGELRMAWGTTGLATDWSVP